MIVRIANVDGAGRGVHTHSARAVELAETRASRWLVANAARFGFSLSYPKGLDAVTGYKWESWHYRYIGAAACALQAEYFGGIQQYLMLFLEAMVDRK